MRVACEKLWPHGSIETRQKSVTNVLKDFFSPFYRLDLAPGGLLRCEIKLLKNNTVHHLPTARGTNQHVAFSHPVAV
jgi:hypothetical protein